MSLINISSSRCLAVHGRSLSTLSHISAPTGDQTHWGPNRTSTFFPRQRGDAFRVKQDLHRGNASWQLSKKPREPLSPQSSQGRFSPGEFAMVLVGCFCRVSGGKEETGIARRLFSFLGNACALKIDVPTGCPVLLHSVPKLALGLARNIAHSALGAAGRGRGARRAATQAKYSARATVPQLQ